MWPEHLAPDPQRAAPKLEASATICRRPAFALSPTRGIDTHSPLLHNAPMTAKQFYDWQTQGGTDDVMRGVDLLERADIAWCAIGGVAVNHWAKQPMVTRDVDVVVVADSIDRTVAILEDAGFQAERFPWSINFTGRSAVSIQLSTESFYEGFSARSVAADVHGILMRVASLEDTLRGKVKDLSTPERRQSKRFKDLADIARLVEAHPELWQALPESLQCEIEQPLA